MGMSNTASRNAPGGREQQDLSLYAETSSHCNSNKLHTLQGISLKCTDSRLSRLKNTEVCPESYRSPRAVREAVITIIVSQKQASDFKVRMGEMDLLWYGFAPRTSVNPGRRILAPVMQPSG